MAAAQDEYRATLATQVDDERQCASYRFVGSALQVSSAVAQRAIHDYCASSNRLAIYLVAGAVGTGPTAMAPREFCLVVSDGLSGAKTRFSHVSSCHAFGAVPAVTPDTCALIYAHDVTVLAKDLLTAESTAAQLYRRNRASGIRCPEVKMLPPGKNAPKPLPAKTPHASFTPKALPSAASKPEATTLKPTSATAFFGKAATTAKAEPAAPSKPSPAPKAAPKAAVKAAVKASPEKRKAPSTEADDGEEAQWNDSDEDMTSKPKPKPKAIDKPKEEPKEEPREEPREAEPPALPLAKAKKEKKQKVADSDDEAAVVEPVTGAMDGFLGGGEVKAKKTKKKLTEKTFIDAKGYMVTENVWEEVTDDEAEAKPKAPTTAAKKPAFAAVAAKPAAGKPAAKPAPAGAQKSMTSFFGKKS